MGLTRILAALIVIFGLLCLSAGYLIADPLSAFAAGSSTAVAPPPRATPAHPASVSASPVPSAVATSAPEAESKVRQIDAQGVISFLGDLIGWYRQISSEAQFATSPADTIFVAENRRLGAQALSLGFDYAHAQASLLRSEYGNAGVRAVPATEETSAPLSPADAAAMPGFGNLAAQRAPAHAEVDKDKALLQRLQGELRGARRRGRPEIQTQMAAVNAQLQLAQSRLGAIDAMLNFEKTATGGHAASGLEAQIDELERSAPPDAQATGAAYAPKPVNATTSASGIVGRAEALIALNQREQNLASRVDQTRRRAVLAAGLRRSLLAELAHTNQRAAAIAAQTASPDIAAIRRGQAEVEQLTTRHDLLVAALLPLSKQLVVLTLYSNNLERWRAAMRQEIAANLRDLAIRVGGLLFLLGAVFFGALIWRQLTFRYVHDRQHRYQLLQLRRITVIIIVALVLLFDFANELGALATVMGFAAAGIAFTLQNVIMSLAGYFYLSGRFGIRVGDRVQITGVNGDVLEIGLFKMTLMELGNDAYGGQPTGRIAVFPNSIVFQSNGNFYKQLPGANFAWNELRLTLAPDCDFRLAEKRLVEVVNEVFIRYRDSVQREYRGVERELNIRIETPRPQSRLHVADTGIELVIRYPVQLLSAVQTSDEIARRLIDAIRREPRLKLATQGTPAIQNEPEPESHKAAAGTISSQPPLPPPAEKSPPRQAAGAAGNASAAASAAAAAVGLTTADSVIADAKPADAQDSQPPDQSKNPK